MKQSEKEFSDKIIRKPSWAQRFFIMCSGSDKSILYQCPSEWNKYSGIGATIFFTGLLASLSATYALYTIFRSDVNALEYATVFGLVWGFMILNLDRFIVSSIRKEGNYKKELLQASPRFLLAIIISVVIAKPLEVKIFESRIEQQILEDKRKKLEDEKLSIDKLNDLTKLENTIEGQNSELGTLDSLRQGDPRSLSFKKLLNDRNIALQDLNNVAKANNPKISDYNFRINQVKTNSLNYREIKDTSGNVVERRLISEARKSINDLSYSRNALFNEIKAKQKRVEDLDTDIQKARNDFKALMAQRINQKEAEIEQTKQTKAQADTTAKIQFNESVRVKQRSYTNNFVTQLEAMGNLTSSNSTMAWISWMIVLLFIVIETAPILVKLLSKRGPYDEILERVEYEHYINEKELISRWNSKINELLDKAKEAAKLEGDTFLQVEKQRLEHELRNNQRILDDLAEKQEGLAKIAIDKWYQHELIKASHSNGSTGNHQQSIENTFWRMTSSPDDVQYFFRNGKSGNQFIYQKKGVLVLGRWKYGQSQGQISYVLQDGLTKSYSIEELTATKLSLMEFGTTETIEFEKAD
jgi:hypothetical protein